MTHNALTKMLGAGIFFVLALLFFLHVVVANPQGAQIVSNVTETAPIVSPGSSTTAGGSFTYLTLNSTSQTPRWKAYVGNVTGRFVLADGTGNAIYDWSLTAVSGQVFVSRSDSVDWSQLQCAQEATILSEQSTLDMTASQVDNINRTFNETIHAAFWSGTTFFTQSSCRAIATYVGGEQQTPDPNADFQVVLLEDTTNVVFAALLEQQQSGFDNRPYDFQLIVPESDQEATPTTYYFYTELR